MNNVKKYLTLLLLLTPTAGAAETKTTDKLSSIFGSNMFDNIYGGDQASNYALISRLVAIGIAESPALQAEQHKLSSAESGVDSAKGAYHPTAALTASVGRIQTAESTDDTTSRTDSAQAGLTVRQNLWRGGTDSAGVRVAKADQEIARLQLDTQKATVSYDISRAALSFHLASIQKRITQAAAEDALEILQLSERKYKAGQSGKIDVFRASMRASEARVSTEKAEVQVNQSLHQLLKHLGRTNPDSINDILTELSAKPIPLPKVLPNAAPVTKTLSEKIAESTSDKTAALLEKARKNRYFPEIDAVAGFSRTISDAATTVLSEPVDFTSSDADKTNKTSLALELSWPIWVRPRDHQITQAWHERAAAESKVEQAKISAYHSGQESYSRLQALYGSLPAHQDAFNQADALYQSQKKLYDAGAIDVFAVNESDSQRVNALGNWYDSIVEIHQTYIRLEALNAGLILP